MQSRFAAASARSLHPVCRNISTAGSLLSFQQKSRFQDFDALLASYEPCFFPYEGISTFRVAEGDEYVLILFYRAELVGSSSSPAADLLCEWHSATDSMEERLESCVCWMRVQDVSPEVGLFFGYPPEDVRGHHAAGSRTRFTSEWKTSRTRPQAASGLRRHRP